MVNSLASLLSLIPRTLSSLLDGLLGSSRRGDIPTLTKHLITLTQNLPGELKSGGVNAILATIQTLDDIFLNLGKNLRRAKPAALSQIFQHLQTIVSIIQRENFAFDFKLISKCSCKFFRNFSKHYERWRTCNSSQCHGSIGIA